MYLSSLCEDGALIKLELLAGNRASQVAYWGTSVLPFKSFQVIVLYSEFLIVLRARLLDF